MANGSFYFTAFNRLDSVRHTQHVQCVACVHPATVIPPRDLNCNGPVSPFCRTLPCAFSAGSVSTAALGLPYLRNRAILARFLAPGIPPSWSRSPLSSDKATLFPKCAQL